tara:strand:+ start:36 stop:776 length:741 start_codon:yes stop_codon:yes gene_type:complete
MRLFIITFLFFKIFSPVYANTIYYLTKIPNLEIYDLTASNGIKYLKAEKSFRVGFRENNVQCDKTTENSIKKKFDLIKKNFNKYDKKFLEKINLKYVVLCENLKVAEIKTAGVPNHELKTLIVDIKFDERYFERSMHHELFHMIEASYKNLFSYKEWEKYNNKKFKYAKCSTCTNKLDLSLINNTKGFLTEYSMSTASEDMAEIFSFLMIKNKKLENIILNDPVLYKKTLFLKNEVLKIDDNYKFN